MGMDKGGPSAMGLYANAGSQSTPADTGLQMGRGLYDADLAARSRYAQPAVPGPTMTPAPSTPGPGPNQVPEYYNFQSALPVKYSVPSAAKERMIARQAVREAAVSSNTLRTDPISEEEVDYLQSMQDQAELADFDRYVNSLIDPRKPGNLKWLMEIYPDFVNRRIQQVHTDYEFALRNQMIDSWGINTFDDLHFKYLNDQGKISGPTLSKHQAASDMYTAGWLSPYNFKNERETGVKLPFTSATIGKSGRNNKAAWTMSDDNQPLGTGRDLSEMAQSMYPPRPSAAAAAAAAATAMET